MSALWFTPIANKSGRDQMVKLVEQMLESHERLSAARTPQEKTSPERQIAATDTQTDRVVYDLCALTEEEIRIVEGTLWHWNGSDTQGRNFGP